MINDIDNVLQLHITTEIKKLTDYAKELTPLLDDSFGDMSPKTQELKEFIDDFYIKLFQHAWHYYDIIPDETGEDPLAVIHNTLQPLWSDATTYPISDDVMSYIGTDMVKHCKIYQRADGVWDINSPSHPAKSVSTCANILDIAVGPIFTIDYGMGMTNDPHEGFTWFEIKRYTK